MQEQGSFKKDICKYNIIHVFTSLCVNINRFMLQKNILYNFRVNRELCHLEGALLPKEGINPTYA